MKDSQKYDLERFFELVPNLLCIAGIDGYFKKVNPAFSKLLGWSEKELLSISIFDLIDPDDISATKEEFSKLSKGKPIISFRNRFRCADGSFKSLEWKVYPEKNDILFAVAHDVTQFKLSNELFVRTIEASPVAIILTDHIGIIQLVNKESERLFGFSRGELLEMNIESLIPKIMQKNHIKLHQIYMKQLVSKPMGSRRDFIALSKSGIEIPVEIGLNPVSTEEENFILVTAVDLTERKNTQQQLENYSQKLDKALSDMANQAHTDSLMNIDNRRAFDKKIEIEIYTAMRNKSSLSLLVLDVDNFKEYNDKYGHPAGDNLLRQIGKILNLRKRLSDSPARIGGDEFAIILPGSDKKGALLIGERILKSIDDYKWEHKPIKVSIGLSTLNFAIGVIGDVKDLSTQIISEADQALYRSKKAGKHQVTYF
jgi:diguanylate cyclase (GGDEF)-like protein/PAS domain S-box-containing protein